MGTPPLPDLSDDARASIYAAMGICFPVAVTAVMMRLLARQLTKARMWIDDCLIIVALVRKAFQHQGSVIEVATGNNGPFAPAF